MELARRIKRQFYGLQSRVVEPFTSITEMAAYYVEAIRTVQPAGPYMLGGWSMGGLVAYEMAVQLQAQGAAVGLVALMDRAAIIEPRRDEAELRELFEAVVANVKEQVRASGSVTQFDSEKYQQYWQVFVNNYRAVEAYRLPRFEGRVVLLSSDESKQLGADETLGWSSVASEVEVHHIPGGHNAMMLAPNVELVAELLRDCMERATKPTTFDNQYEFSHTASLH
jgi:thioesterase domain-containing protein